MFWTITQRRTTRATANTHGRPAARHHISARARLAGACSPHWRGTEPLNPPREERKFLADGDEVILRGYCLREGARRIGMGECRGIIEATGG